MTQMSEMATMTFPSAVDPAFNPQVCDEKVNTSMQCALKCTLHQHEHCTSIEMAMTNPSAVDSVQSLLVCTS